MFDSHEYVRRLSENNLFTAIVSGHMPLHAGYIVFFWPIFNLARVINLDSLYSVMLSQTILATFSIYFYYKIIKILIDKKVAFFSAIIASIIPLYWIANITLMIETVYVSFFIFSIYLLLSYLRNNNFYYLFLSSVLLGFSFFTQFSVILWIPFVIYLIYYLRNKINFKIIFYYLISIFIFGFINIYLISLNLKLPLSESFFLSYLGHKGDIPVNINIYGILVYLRNFFIPFFYNYTNAIIILALISLINLYTSNKKVFWLFFLFIIPSILLNQAWDSLFYGRHSLIVGFGFVALVCLLIKRNIKYYYILIIYLLIVILPQLFIVNNVPYLIEANIIKSLPKGLLIVSHFERPYIEGVYKGENLNTYSGKLEKKIDEYLIKRQNIFITSAAISDPYGLYSGPYLHNLSLSYKNPYLLQSLLEKYSVTKYKVINIEDNLIIYRIDKKGKSSYPAVKIMRNNRRRLDYFDPITQFWLFIDERFRILHEKY